MKLTLHFGILFVLIATGMANGTTVASGAGSPGENIAPPKALQPVHPITDLVLIYDGGQRRQPWTVDRFRPYVYREAEGQFDWLFDGFLFIEYLAKSGARLCPITSRKDATKRDWQELMDHYFQEGESLAALDQLLDVLAVQGHKPARRRQVVITLPTPITGSKPGQITAGLGWGQLDGREMDFGDAADRLKAATWYVDEVLKRWEQRRYKHLSLAGFYWVFERAWKDHQTHIIGDYIRSKSSRLYWIPSWPQGRRNWKDYGFDFVYQQPNYFFHRQPTPPDRLHAACVFASSCGTSMEMEFDDGLLKDERFLGYFDEYIAAYEKFGVWKAKPVAYYEGGGTWGKMAASGDPAVRKRFDALSAIVIDRQKRADRGFVFSQDAKTSP